MYTCLPLGLRLSKLHSIAIVHKFYILTGSQPTTHLDTFICTEVDTDAGKNLSGPPSAPSGSSHGCKRSMINYALL